MNKTLTDLILKTEKIEWKLLNPFQPDKIKKTTPERMDKLKKSLLNNGFAMSFYVFNDQSKIWIIDGHHRLKALHELEKEGNDIPTHFTCSFLDVKDKTHAKKLVLAFNSHYAEIQQDGLLDWISDLNFDEVKSEFEFFELGFDLGIEGSKDEGKDDIIPESCDQEKSKLGDIFILGNHRIMCGSSIDINHVEQLLNNNKPDVVFSDPPYGIDVVQSNKIGGDGETHFGNIGGGKIVESKRYKKIEGDSTTDAAKDFYELCLSINIKNIVLWGGNYFTDFLPASRCWIIWDKEMTGNFSEAEMAWTSFSKGGIKVFKHLWNGLAREGNKKDELKTRVHPTQKPVGLFEKIFIKFDGFKTIFDGFLGSGTSIIAAEKTNRICYGMEIDPHYIDVIIKRWQDFTGKEAVRESDGIKFNDL